MTDAVRNLLDECSSELVNLETTINSLDPLDKTRAFLTKYALIKTSGTLEYAFRSIIADYFSRFHIPQIETYLNKTIRENSSSVIYDNICTVLGRFDETWKQDFKTRMQDRNQVIQSAKSLVTNRHAFAHGSEPTATFNDIKQYYNDVLLMINELDSVLT